MKTVYSCDTAGLTTSGGWWRGLRVVAVDLPVCNKSYKQKPKNNYWQNVTFSSFCINAILTSTFVSKER